MRQPWFRELVLLERRVLHWVSPAPDTLGPRQLVPTASAPQSSPWRWGNSLTPCFKGFKGTSGTEGTSRGSRESPKRCRPSPAAALGSRLRAAFTRRNEGTEGLCPNTHGQLHGEAAVCLGEPRRKHVQLPCVRVSGTPPKHPHLPDVLGPQRSWVFWGAQPVTPTLRIPNQVAPRRSRFCSQDKRSSLPSLSCPPPRDGRCRTLPAHRPHRPL